MFLTPACLSVPRPENPEKLTQEIHNGSFGVWGKFYIMPGRGKKTFDVVSGMAALVTQYKGLMLDQFGTYVICLLGWLEQYESLCANV
jgi:hypothetical protein